MNTEAIRQAIESARRELAERTGRLASANAELIELVGTDDPDKVERRLRKMEAEIEDKSKVIGKELEALFKEISSIQNKLADRSAT
jgi:outer membrane protein TolC